MSVIKACQYLSERRHLVGQSMLDQDRLAIQFLLRQIYNSPVKLPRIYSECARKIQPRAYSAEQVEAIAKVMTARGGLSTRIAYTTGLRAHELYTLRRTHEQPKTRNREWSNQRFLGRQGVRYTVRGNGGLVRKVMLSTKMSNMLESQRLSESRTVTDRGIYYKQTYDLLGGQYFSEQFSNASRQALNRSSGAHGLRHGYAQDRMLELANLGMSRAERLAIVSQELGHFRSDITQAYLR